MMTFIKDLFKAPLGLENIHSLDKAHEKFGLEYQTLEVGTLTLDNGVWTFRYSDDFKAQQEVQPLINFPDKEKVYQSQELWPFFLSRIPGLNQPAVQEVLKEENIDKNDEAALLKRFGKRSISNPFVLSPEFA